MRKWDLLELFHWPNDTIGSVIDKDVDISVDLQSLMCSAYDLLVRVGEVDDQRFCTKVLERVWESGERADCGYHLIQSH